MAITVLIDIVTTIQLKLLFKNICQKSNDLERLVISTRRSFSFAMTSRSERGGRQKLCDDIIMEPIRLTTGFKNYLKLRDVINERPL